MRAGAGKTGERASGAAAWRFVPPVIVRRAAPRAAWLLAVAVCAAVVIGAAYQTHPAFDIAIGDRTQDDALVVDFNAAERQPASGGGRVYRWTRGAGEIVLPGIGRTAAMVTLTMAGGANPDPAVVVLANGGTLGRVRLSPDFAEYSFPIPAPYLTTGNLTLTIQAATFRAPGDRRDLGVLVSRVRVQPEGGLTRPPARTALALWGTAVLLMLAFLAVGLRGAEAGALAALAALGFGVLLVRDRLFIALGAPAWLRVAAGSLLLAVALRLVVPPLLRRLGIAGGAVAARWLLAAVLGVFAVRLGGLYHPAMIVSDLVFHVHRMEDVLQRRIWYQEIPAIYDQNRPVPYLPGAYLLFAPFAPIVRNWADLLTVGTQLLDATRALVIGLVVWRALDVRPSPPCRPEGAAAPSPATLGAAPIAAACAALIAAVVPVAFLVYSWGNLTNAVGEWALTLLFALLALAAERLRRPGWAAAFVAVVLLALLSHIGVAVTAVALLGTTLAVWAVAVVRARRGYAPWLAALALTCVAGALAVALFYRIPLGAGGARVVTEDPSIPAQPVATAAGGRYEIGGPRPDPTIGLNDARTDNPLVAVAGQLWVEAYAFYRVWPLLLAPLGWWLLWRVGGARGPGGGDRIGAARRLAVLCLIWFGVSLAFLVAGVLAGRYVRYALTAIPAVAVGAGVALGYGWRWRWGRVVAVALLAFSVATTLLIWYGRITRAYHF